MDLKEEGKKATVSELVKKSLGWILGVLSPISATAIFSIRAWLERNISFTQLIIIAAIETAIIFGLLAWIYKLRGELKKNTEYKFRFNVKWDKNKDPHCVDCLTHLIGTQTSALFCIKCKVLFELQDDVKTPITLSKAKELLAETTLKNNKYLEAETSQNSKSKILDDLSNSILELISESNENTVWIFEIYEDIKIEKIKIIHCINQLEKGNYIRRSNSDAVPSIFLTEKGVEYVATVLIPHFTKDAKPELQ